MATNKIKCPECDRDIELVPVSDNPARSRAMCACDGGTYRVVYETDTPGHVAPVVVDAPEESKEKEPSDWLRSNRK